MAGPTIISADRSAQLRAFDPRWRLKLGLHASTILITFLGIVLFSAAIPQWNANFFHNKGPSRGDWTDGMCIGPLAFTFLFSILSIIHFFSRQKPMPPKVCIVVLALTLLSLGPALFLAGHGSLFRHWQNSAVRGQNGGLVCNMLNIFSRECEPILYSVGELQIGGMIFGSLVWTLVLVHLLISVCEARTERVTKPRLPRRLTLNHLEHGERLSRHQSSGATRKARAWQSQQPSAAWHGATLSYFDPR